jgi:hypothetical protein
MNFRKGIFALALGSLGLTGIASAQYTCTSATATTGTAFVRVEGTTELVPSLTIGGCTVGATPTSATITVTTSAGVTNANVPSQSYTDATATFFGGTAVNGTLSGNVLTFTASGAGLGATLGSGIVIAGVRVNAASVPVNTSITETATAGPNVILTSPAAAATPIAYTQQGMAKPVFQGFANKAICAAGTAVVPLGQAAVSSGFNGAFVPEGTGSDLYISVNFGNLAGGANYYVPVTINSANGTDVLNVTKAELVASNTTTAVQTGSAIGPSGGTQVSGVAQLTATNGSGSALYHLTGASAAGVEAFIVPLYGVATTGATAGVTSSPTVTATFVGNGSASYDQFSSTQNPASVSASGSAAPLTGLAWPTTPGALTGVTTGGGQLTTCATTLLFPYILNAGGYDTGIALTNASAGTSLSQDGTCSVKFYGTGVPATNPYVTGTITAGSVGAFTVSSQASGFVGYAIATCNFQDAHGFAFITDGFGAPGRGLSQGYLAIVTSAGGTAITTSPF